MSSPTATLAKLEKEPLVTRVRTLGFRMPSWETYLGWTPDERREISRIGVCLVREFTGWQSITAAIRELKELRFEPAIDLMAELWLTCPAEGIRTCCQFSLYEMKTPNADAILEKEVETFQYTQFATRAMLRSDCKAAYDTLLGRFSPEALATAPGAAIADAILGNLAPVGFTGAGADVWPDPMVPTWLREEPRWIELATRLKRDKSLGSTARALIKSAPTASTAALGSNRKQDASISRKHT